MRASLRRPIGYGASALVVAGLLWAGFVHEGSADVGTLLGSAEVQLRLAMSMPAKDKAGRPLPAREQLLREVSDLLDRIDARGDRPFESIELRAFLAYATGEPGRGAELYRQALAHPGCAAEYRADLLLNRCGLLAEAGEPEQALRELRAAEGGMNASERARSRLRQAEILDRIGRRGEARGAAIAVLEDSAVGPVRWIEAGRMLERLGDPAAAMRAYAQAAPGDPLAEYHLARLKVLAGEIDNGLTLLERAAAAAGPRVRDLVRRDRAAWESCAANARFQSVMQPSEPAAPAGR
jgi:tetratricopeptide (TPR) repeat protein